MRTCDKCGKANQPTRKYCIRCGSSLIKEAKPKAQAILPEAPAPAVPEAPATPPPETTPTATEDTFVKPSSVSTDRVRSAGGLTRPKSEFEKAKEAFAKAETVGIDEPGGSGIVETRMLRASEVKELLEGPGVMAGGEDVPPPTMMEGSEPLPPEAAHLMPPAGPTASQIEESILGSKSAYVEQPPEPEPEPVVAPPVADGPVSAEVPSTEYEMEGDVPVLEATTAEEAPAAAMTYDEPAPAPTPAPTPAAPVTTPPTAEVPPAEAQEDPDADLELVIACPDCGKIINVDMFEYPKDVYSKMGAARLKQARFFVVQGNPNDAMNSVRKARALYEKADDKKGLKEVLKLVESLAKAG
ncbi:MAG: zinc finger Ran-binding domain-containing protein [Candidatus Thorarchaeota archaeon]